ncbi:MAG TPA: hypothetical protein VEH57_04210 [Thermoplasmata archaeon]|nr:hypothetical protein [Thermoplasmata archaeon]
MTPATIAWLPGLVVPSGSGVRDEMDAEPLALPKPHVIAHVPRFVAWRCAKCRLIEFLYDDTVVM